MARVVVCRIGEGDGFTPVVSPDDTLLPISIEQAGSLASAGTTVRRELERVAVTPVPAAVDLLNLATAVYSADVCTRRTTAYDRWTREYRLYLPVSDVERWAAASEHVSRLLGFLSGDRWSVEFRPLVKPFPPFVRRKRAKPAIRPTAVSLFSGGLDSFVGVLNLLEQGHTVSFVGHYSTGPTSQAQDAVNSALAAHYPDRTSFFRFYVRPPKLNGSLPEPSTRSRSILFLALGTLVAFAFGEPLPLYVPENGLISLNVPLTPARSGTLSTRTTHPHYIAMYRELLRLVGLNTPVETPYRFQTKGEMVAAAANPDVFREVAPRTLSCSHPDVGRYRGVAPGRHCGYCVPCLIRRASLAHIGADDAEHYLIDVLRNPPGAGTETGKDFRAFEMALARLRGGHRALLEVLNSGPLPPEDVSAYAAVYERGMEEVGRLLSPTRIA
jgi:hypothetical protein